MSALYTHYKLGNDVLKKLSKKQQNEIKKELDYYNMFNQGFDNLYYYLFKWKYYRTFGIKAHKKKIDLFFKEVITYIKENNLETDSTITNLVYGFINHYTLDTIIHPYINYQVKNLNIPHTKIEFMLDSQIKNIANTYHVLIPRLKFNKELLELINHVFFKVHNEKNIGKIFNKSHNLGHYIYRYFINDNTGIKTAIYKFIDFIFPFMDITLHENTFYTKEFDKRILNVNKDTWHHPTNTKEKYNYSYEELYNIALEISIKLNKKAYQVLNNKIELEDLLIDIKLIHLNNIQQLLER